MWRGVELGKARGMALTFQPATFRGHRSRAPSSLACAVRGMTMTTIPPTGHPHLCMGVSAPVPRASFAPNAIAGAATGYDQGNRYLAIVTQVCDSRSFCIPRGRPCSVFQRDFVLTQPPCLVLTCAHPLSPPHLVLAGLARAVRGGAHAVDLHAVFGHRAAPGRLVRGTRCHSRQKT